MSEKSHLDWKWRQERSSVKALRFMCWASLKLGRRTSRIILCLITLYFLLLAPAARRASQSYLRLALDRPAKWRDIYRHFHAFASTVHDRVYLLNNHFEMFQIEAFGKDELLSEVISAPGALLVGAHLGSFDVLRAVGKGLGQLKVSMLMYEENAQKINAALDAINPQAGHDIIQLGRMESMVLARERLDDGHLVGMLADRFLDDDSYISCQFLGKAVRLPIGPWRLAILMRRPVFFMTGLYFGGNRYEVHFEKIADFSQVSRSQREAAMAAAVQVYADRLSQFCRAAPYNWFNFFDIWEEP